jgi:hypothetical protein
MNEREANIHKWIHKISTVRPELSNFAICPFASQAKFKIIETTIDDIEPIEEFDVVIFIVEDKLTLNDINQWIDIYRRVYSEWDFFEDCKSYDTFIGGVQTNNGLYNLVLCQPKNKLRKFRSQLAKTEYYDHWDRNYLQEILGDDYDLIENG